MKIYAVVVENYLELFEVIAAFTTENARDDYLRVYKRLEPLSVPVEFPLNPKKPKVLEVVEVTMSLDGAYRSWKRAAISGQVVLGFRRYTYTNSLTYTVATGDREEAVRIVKGIHDLLEAQGVWGKLRATRKVLNDLKGASVEQNI